MLVRCGETPGVEEGQLLGTRDTPLSPLGDVHGNKAGEFLMDLQVNSTALVCPSRPWAACVSNISMMHGGRQSNCWRSLAQTFFAVCARQHAQAQRRRESTGSCCIRQACSCTRACAMLHPSHPRWCSFPWHHGIHEELDGGCHA